MVVSFSFIVFLRHLRSFQLSLELFSICATAQLNDRAQGWGAICEGRSLMRACGGKTR